MNHALSGSMAEAPGSHALEGVVRFTHSRCFCMSVLDLAAVLGTTNSSLRGKETRSKLSVAKEAEMIHQRQFDDLIRAAWEVIESDFDEAAFVKWRKMALACFTQLLGPDHPYTLSFQDHVKQAEALSVLAGKGLLVAAREQTATEDVASSRQRAIEPGLHFHESQSNTRLEDCRI